MANVMMQRGSSVTPQTGREARLMIRRGEFTGPTSGLAPNFGQGNLVILPAEHTKNRKGACQPLAAALVADLRTYLVGRPRKEPVWPGTWSKQAANILRADLDAAGLPVEVDGPEGTETRD